MTLTFWDNSDEVKAIIEAISNDLGTPEALRIIDEAFDIMSTTPLSKINNKSLIQMLETIDSALGLKLIDSTKDIPDEAKQIIIERNIARQQKDWSKSDDLRNILLAKGITVQDSNNEPIWKYLD